MVRSKVPVHIAAKQPGLVKGADGQDRQVAGAAPIRPLRVILPLYNTEIHYILSAPIRS